MSLTDHFGPQRLAWHEDDIAFDEPGEPSQSIVCGQEHDHGSSTGAAGAIIRAPRANGSVAYLLQQRSKTADEPGTWSVFGGGLHDGEDPRAGAQREMKEELGSTPVPYTLSAEPLMADDHGGWRYTTYLADASEAFWPSFDGETPEETAGWGWFTPQEMLDLPLHPGFEKTLLPSLIAGTISKAAMVSKASVDYRGTSSSSRRCGTCVMFHLNGTCDLVRGVIRPGDVCDRWEAKTAEKTGPRGWSHGWVFHGSSGDESAPAHGEFRLGADGDAAWHQPHRELVKAGLQLWKDDPTSLKLHMSDARDGSPAPASGGGKKMRAQAEALLREVMSAPLNREPLYRGASHDDSGVVGWSDRKHVAQQFAGRRGSSLRTLPSGSAPAIRVADYIDSHADDDEHEWLAYQAEPVEKQLHRIVDLNGQESWQDLPEPGWLAAGGGAPLPPGGVPGGTAGGEPPRWDGSQQEPRLETAPDDADDARWPTEGRVVSPRPGASFPAQYMDGYWPQQHGLPAAGTLSPGEPRGVPPSTVRKHLSVAWLHEHRDAGGKWTRADLDAVAALRPDGRVVSADSEHPVVSFGDVSTAKSIIVFVPGAKSSLTAHADDSGGSAGLPTAFGHAAQLKAAAGDDAATIAWGYHAPPSVVASVEPGFAKRAAPVLSTFVSTLKAQRPDAHITVIGHSYGAYTAAVAAHKSGMKPDDLVLVGSPGASAHHASDLNVERGHTWVGINSHDSVGRAADFLDLDLGGNPARERFGASVFDSENPLADYEAEGTTAAHSSYFQAGSGGLANIARIATGDYGSVTPSRQLALAKMLSVVPVISKVGAEGYIHGYICVRPPCGPRYAEASHDAKTGKVQGAGRLIGKQLKKEPGDQGYSIAHVNADGSKVRLGGQYATRNEAAKAVASYHNIGALKDDASGSGSPAASDLESARAAMVAGDHDGAISHLGSASSAAEASGSHSLAAHIGDTRTALDEQARPLNQPEQRAPGSAVDWEAHKSELLSLARREKAGSVLGEPARDKVLERMAQVSGYDAKPEKGRLDPSKPVMYRGFGDRYDHSNGAELARQYTGGAYYGSTGQHGNGAYFTTNKDIAAGYGHTIAAQLKPGAKVASEDELWDQLDSLPPDWKEVIGDDVGKLGVMRGYDAVKAPGTVTIVMNRGALRVPGDEKEEAPSPKARALTAPRMPATLKPVSPAASPGSPETLSSLMAPVEANDDVYNAVPKLSSVNVSAGDKQAVFDYTGGNVAGPLNKLLRTGDTGKEDRFGDPVTKAFVEDTAAKLDSVFAASEPIKQPVTVYRGVKNADAVFGTPGDRVGSTFTDKGFTSTSSSPRVAGWFGQVRKPGNAIVTISVPEGSKVVNPDQMGMFGDVARELLLDRGGTYKVISDEVTPTEVPSEGRLDSSEPVITGVRHIKLEKLPSGKPEKVAGSDVIKSTAPLSDDPPPWLQHAYDEYERLGDEAEKHRAPSGSYGFTSEGEEIRRRQSHILYGDPFAPYKSEANVGANERAINEGISAARQQKASLLAINKSRQAHLATESNLTPEAASEQMTAELKQALAGRRVATRVTNGTLSKILTDGDFKTQFETGRSKALKANGVRANLEEVQFGYPDDLKPELRPQYGYMDEGYDRPAGIGSRDMMDFNTDQLSSFGTTQVIFKDAVRGRTTFNVGDSMDNKHSSLPSRLSDPQARSFAAFGKEDGGMANPGVLKGLNRDYNSADFRGSTFIEAQVHSPDGSARPLTASDIDHVIFPATPPAALRQQLSGRSVPWHVMNARTIARSGTAEEKSRALTQYRQDLASASDRLDWLSKRDNPKSWAADVAAVKKARDQLEQNISAIENAG